MYIGKFILSYNGAHICDMYVWVYMHFICVKQQWSIVIVQACRNPEIVLAEYAHPVTSSSSEATTSAPKAAQPSTPLPNPAATTDICQHIDSLQDKINTYTVLLKRPHGAMQQRKLCLKVTKKLKNHANKSDSFVSIIYPEQSCQNNGSDTKLLAKLNLKALKYVSLQLATCIVYQRDLCTILIIKWE